jgi:hypothetical protein
MVDDIRICEVFSCVAELALARGHKNIRALGTPLVMDVGEHWKIAVNGTADSHDIMPDGTMGAKLEPIECAVWWNGWLAGLFNPKGGSMAHGSEANEDTLIAALKEATDAEKH